MTFFVTLALLAIITCLGAALFFMLRSDTKNASDDDACGKHMARALALRVGLSIVLFVCLFGAWKLG